MGIFILAAILLIVFAAYRIYLYKKQRQIEEDAANAQAYVSAEIVELLQKIKTLIVAQGGQVSPEIQHIQDQVKNQLENMYCHTDSDASVREYLSAAKQDLALIQVKLQKISAGAPIEQITPQVSQTYPSVNHDEFDALK